MTQAASVKRQACFKNGLIKFKSLVAIQCSHISYALVISTLL